ncbi:hypothetical protein PISL3812_01717 [Talaromyces islandicus]|uniref:Ribosome biogenesis protein Alb1 n=1 Tax=Talaromyces islandicus TaxID=28573 RepID=A0A0U1LMX4_TALIS|nr:hypothetical protein PISL3812_01717 [Talaromyces islandicus]
MGRTGKLKKKSDSLHSRAARRETSPSADVDKSLKSMPRVEAPAKQPLIHAAGISKKKSKTKAMSRAQRLRQQKSIERAESVMDQLETKVAKSIGKAKAVNARKAQWEDLNSKHDAAVKILQETQDDEEMESEQPSETTTNSHQPIISHAGGNIIPPDTHEVIDEDDEIT